jgi:MFS family permease
MPRALWLLVIGMAVNVTGSSFLWPLNSIYIHDHLGKSMSISGMVLMINSATSVVGNLIGGHLFDRIGGYRSILLGIGITVLALFGLTFWNGWPEYVIFLAIVGFGSGIVFPSMYAMAGSVWKEGGRKAFNAIYVASNLGVAIGSALGGIVAAISFRWIFLANALLYLIFLFIALFGYKGIKTQVGKQANNPSGRMNANHHSQLHALLILCVGFMLSWVGYCQWQATIGPYTQEIGLSLKQYSLLWTINGALIVLGQPILAKMIKYLAKSVKKQIILGTLIFVVAFIIASQAQQFTAFAVAMMIMTIGEMLVWPAVPTIADKLAPIGREGFYQGIVNSTATAGRMIGPLLGGILIDMYDMHMLFRVMIVLFILSIFTTIIYDRKLKATNGPTAKAS